MNYYAIEDNVYFPNRWYLGDIEYEGNNWDLCTGEKIKRDISSLFIEVFEDGLEMDFTIAEGIPVPIINQKVKKAIEHLKSIKFIPIEISNKEVNNTYFALIVEKKVNCIDEEKSIFEKFSKNDSVRPDLAGDFSSIDTLFINEKMVSKEPFFRLKYYDLQMVVDEPTQLLLSEFSGIKFTLIT